MSMLTEVCWPTVAAALAESADPPVSALAAQHTDPHAQLAVLVLGEHFCRLRGILCHAGIGDSEHDYDRADTLVAWLQAAAHLALCEISLELDPPPAATTATGHLELDPALEHLPLLDLATNVAALTGGCQVVARALPPGAAGRHTRRLIELDIEQAGQRLAEIWAHELGHLLDGWQHDDEQRERYADHLGDLLLEHRPPTLGDAWPLCSAAHDAITTSPRFATLDNAEPADSAELPAAGTASTTAFRRLLLTDVRAAA